MSLLDKLEVQDLCGHTALHARKWSIFICIALVLLKKEEEEEEEEEKEEEEVEERRMPNRNFFTSRGADVKLCYIAML